MMFAAELDLNLSKDETLEGIIFNKKHKIENADGISVSTVLTKALDLKPLLMEEISNVLNHFTVYDVTKVSIASLLVDNWALMKDGRKKIYFKHVFSERNNVLYQIVLGSGDSDGVYELNFNRKKFETSMVKAKIGKTLLLHCPSNYDIAQIPKCGSLLRDDFETEEEFVEKLIKHNLITEEEAEIYVHPDKVIEPYLLKHLPKIEFI